MKRKKDSLKISNIFNNKNINSNSVNNKYKNQIEQNNIHDTKKNNIYYPTDNTKSNSKYTGKKKK